MDIDVRVMSDGVEVDRISRPPQLDHGVRTVAYRGRQWQVLDGCIHLDRHYQVAELDELKWAFLVTSTLPKALPSDLERCLVLLHESFRGALPDGVAVAAAHLSVLGLESQARLLLVDFLKEKHDGDKLYKVLKMKLIFRERSNRLVETMTETKAVEESRNSVEYSSGDDFDWLPSPDGLEAPALDDSDIKKTALQVQSSIGAYRATEVGAQPLDLDGLDEEFGFDIDYGAAGVVAPDTTAEALLVNRLAALGDMAVDLLAYFADNPGDKAVHAEDILGYPLVEINKLLNGSLGFYIKRAASGGWECHTWTLDVLAVLASKHR